MERIRAAGGKNITHFLLIKMNGGSLVSAPYLFLVLHKTVSFTNHLKYFELFELFKLMLHYSTI